MDAASRLIATDGVFSMDGYVANLKDICALAERYGALVMVDDCHATGHLGAGGRGTPTLTGVGDKVDIITGTLGKSLGGAMGGFVASAQPVIDLLRQRAVPISFQQPRSGNRRGLPQSHRDRRRRRRSPCAADAAYHAIPAAP